MQYLWVAELRVSQRTAEKIRQRHHIDPGAVREAVVCAHGLPFVWDEHPERGLRVLVKVAIDGYRTLVVLYPADDPLGDVYDLGSAYRIP